jgi:hypothetical protein
VGNRPDPDDDDTRPDLGPDERDRDLLDGSWEQEYYSGQQKVRDWNAAMVGVALLVVAAIVIPMLLAILR